MVSPFGVVDIHNNKKPSFFSYAQFAGLPFTPPSETTINE
jgi:hypothetical protein